MNFCGTFFVETQLINGFHKKQMDQLRQRSLMVEKILSEHALNGKSILVIGKRCSGKTYLANLIRNNICGTVRIYDDCEPGFFTYDVARLIMSNRHHPPPTTLIFCVSYQKHVPPAIRYNIDHVIEITPTGITHDM